MSSLTLVPGPLGDYPFSEDAIRFLRKHWERQGLILVESEKEGRRKWLKSGLPREAIESFRVYNEHTWKEELPVLELALRDKKRVAIMSDEGLPAFYDPGRALVDFCHDNALKVTATSFGNSISLAVALSGLEMGEFYFKGMLPRKSEERPMAYEEIRKRGIPTVVMDTAYRLKKVIEEVGKFLPDHTVFFGCELNRKAEFLWRGTGQNASAGLVEIGKKDFILIISPRR